MFNRFCNNCIGWKDTDLLKNIAMKMYLLLTVLLSYSLALQSQPLHVGDKVPDLSLSASLLPGHPEVVVNQASLKQFKGSVVILDFWATWCGPCISAMSKYEKYQQKFGKKLQVIGITHEAIARIQRFATNRPVGFMLTIDTAAIFRKYFEYHTIPHVVIIDPEGVVRAITHSENVTEKVIEQILHKESVSLPLKADNVAFDMEADYFRADSNTREAFVLQPGIEGVGSFSKIGQGVFKGRRVSMHNFTIDGLYRMAYKVSYFRMAYAVDQKEFEYKNPKNRYCLDVIVPDTGNSVYAKMQEELPKYFDIRARWEKRKMPVYVLKTTGQPLTFKKSGFVNDLYGASSNHFSGEGVRISSLAEYLENFGITGTPVIDETGIEGRYDIQMEWQPEKRDDWKEVFRKAGLQVIKEEREIDVLVVYRS